MNFERRTPTARLRSSRVRVRVRPFHRACRQAAPDRCAARRRVASQVVSARRKVARLMAVRAGARRGSAASGRSDLRLRPARRTGRRRAFGARGWRRSIAARVGVRSTSALPTGWRRAAGSALARIADRRRADAGRSIASAFRLVAAGYAVRELLTGSVLRTRRSSRGTPYSTAGCAGRVLRSTRSERMSGRSGVVRSRAPTSRCGHRAGADDGRRVDVDDASRRG